MLLLPGHLLGRGLLGGSLQLLPHWTDLVALEAWAALLHPAPLERQRARASCRGWQASARGSPWHAPSPSCRSSRAARPHTRPQTVERHLQRLGAAHIEGIGAYEDHHMFSLEELHAAIA